MPEAKRDSDDTGSSIQDADDTKVLEHVRTALARLKARLHDRRRGLEQSMRMDTVGY